ncbi:MAG: hypothetical protein IPK99_05660 [Flavobacteriales bacterium]|nr:hypothetical protein [Flavobacteriales bacterium]
MAGQIALSTGCTGYNFTYLHRGLSFTSALLDGFMQVGAEGQRNVLVGGAESITPDYYTVQKRTGLWKEPEVPSLSVLSSRTTGALCGEGAAFFVLTIGRVMARTCASPTWTSPTAAGPMALRRE